MPAKAGAKLRLPDAKGAPVEVAAKVAVYTVVEQKGKELRLTARGQSGWASRDEWVPLTDAPAHYTDLIRAAPKDPTRMFTPNQRLEGFARAGGRCEFEAWMFIRCHKDAHHGDHHYPWSKGGATSMANFTAACVRCNTSKGAKLPGFFSTIRMEARRRKYFPAGIPVKAGQRFAQR